MNDLTKIEEMILIAIWRLKEEAYGYNIRKYISRLIQKDFSYGNLYSVLGQLVRKGYVMKSTDDSEDQKQGKQKIYYSVTRLGIASLKTAKMEHNTLWNGITGLLPDES